MKKKRVKKEEEGEKEEEEEGDGGMVTRGKMFTVSLWVCAFFFFFVHMEVLLSTLEMQISLCSRHNGDECL